MGSLEECIAAYTDYPTRQAEGGNCLKSGKIIMNLQLQHLGCEVLSQLCFLIHLDNAASDWRKRANGIKKLQIHCEKQRWLMNQPYAGERTLRLWVKKHKSRICYICKKWIEWKDIEVDHFIPVIAWGYSIVSNLFNTHSWCNKRKGRKLI